MQKFFKYYLPVLIFLGASGILFLGYMFTEHLGVLKYIAGELGMEGKGKIISTKVNAVVKEDGVEQKRIKTFEDDGQIYLVFEKTEDSDSDVLIVDKARDVLIVDKARKDIFAPNSGNNCFDLLFSRYLIQTECGKSGGYLGSEKYEGYRTKMEITDSQITFRLPKYNYGKVVRDRKMEIIFKGK